MKLFYFLPITALAGHEREFGGTCGGEIISDTVITSPDFDTEPWHYKNHNCTWEVDFGEGVDGFVIVPKHFQLEDTGSSCADFIEIKNDQMHLSICGGILDDTDYAAFASSSYSSYSSSSSSEYPDYTGASSSDFWDRRKRRSGDFEGEVQHRGFEEPLWVSGRKATITFISDEHREFRGFELEITANKMNMIQSQAEKIFSALAADLKWKDRFVNRLTKILNLANSSYTGEKCAEENGFENEIPSELIFDAEDTCSLNDQVNRALNSFAKRNEFSI